MEREGRGRGRKSGKNREWETVWEKNCKDTCVLMRVILLTFSQSHLLLNKFSTPQLTPVFSWPL